MLTSCAQPAQTLQDPIDSGAPSLILTSSPEPEPSPTETPRPFGGFATYADPTGRYTFPYPEKWKLSSSATGDANFSGTVTVYSPELNEAAKTYDELPELGRIEVTTGRSEEMDGLGDYSDRRPLTIAGYDAVAVVLTRPHPDLRPDLSFHGRAVLHVNGLGYSINVASAAADPSEYEALFHYIIEHFEVGS